MRIAYLILLFGFILYYKGLAQPALSPKFDGISEQEFSRASQPKILTISVKDIDLFVKDFPKVDIIYAHYPSGSLVVRVEKEQFSKLLQNKNVLFIDIPGIPQVESVLKNPNFLYNRIRKAQSLTSLSWGEDIRVAVKEEAFKTDDIDLIHRSFETALTPGTTSQHATDMATLISGAGNFEEAGRGVLPNAHLTSTDFSNLLPDEASILNSNEISIQNHSYGVSVENYYGVESVAYDQSVIDNPTHLHVFSSGNFGSVLPQSGAYLGMPYANLSGTFKQAKNVLLVNAVDTSYSVNIRNSIGPAYDGRLKPELTAFGAGGTSEAAALVSGSAGLIHQLFKTKEGSLPEASLVKALLIAGASDLGAPGIDFKTGYGGLNLARSAAVLEASQYSLIEIGPQEIQTVSILVPVGVHELKVATVWNDPPAPINANQALVHDVDTRLNYGSASWEPWVLSSFPLADSLNKSAIRKPDHLNNVEFITLKTPEAGTYTLEIQTPILSTSAQKVAVAWYLEMENTFVWDYPIGSSKLISGSRVDLLWDTSIDEPGKLEMKLGNGDWALLKEQVSLKERYQWLTPDTSALCQLRMTLSNQTYDTDPFILSKKLQPSVSFNCENSLGLIWSGLDEAEKFHVYRMGNERMELIGEPNDSSFIVAELEASPYFSIAPVIGEVEGIRSLAFDYSFSGTYCYINFFSVERTADFGVVIKLSLSTLDQIEKVEIRRMHYGIEEVVFDDQPSQLSLEIPDDQATPGLSTYQAILKFSDGTTRYSDTSELYLEPAGKVLIFPNPSEDSFLNILSEGTGQVFKIYTQDGKFMFQKELFYPFDYVIIYDLQSGNYFYRLEEDGKIIDSGRFVKR